MFISNPILTVDFYKVGHKSMYPEGMVELVSNFTPRSNKLAPVSQGQNINEIVVLGTTSFVQELHDTFERFFFDLPFVDIEEDYKNRCLNSLGVDLDIQHVKKLHDLQHLPIEIRALPEGSIVNPGIPVLMIRNTQPGFGWLVNYLETWLSAELWKPMTTASIALAMRKLLQSYAKQTGASEDFVKWQGHDFSMRGMSGVHDAARSGIGHLSSFYGTDTIPAIEYAETYYNGTVIAGSVPATEHSVMCAGGEDDELFTFGRLITKVVPSGIVSIVSDTWDYWKVLSEYTVILKEEIMSRPTNAFGQSKVVFRPDSGDPVLIVCGDPDAPEGSLERKGSIEVLWDIFGGTVNAAGYKELDPHVGLIYGDSITLDRAEKILQGLKEKGFASSNIVFGVGSFSYQYLTRDTFSFAMKATSAVVQGVRRDLQKNPKTGSGKTSAKGLLRVDGDNQNGYTLVQGVDEANFTLTTGAMQVIYRIDAGVVLTDDFDSIRARIDEYVTRNI